MIKIIALAFATGLCIFTSPAHALFSQPAGTVAGGGISSSAGYRNTGVIAQPGIIGHSSSSVYDAEHGLLPVLGGWKILYPEISASPGILTFILATGGSGTNSLAIANTGGSTLNWSVAKETPTASWFSFTPSSGSGNASLEVTANAAGLSPGTYTDNLIIHGAGIARTIQVQLSLTVETPTSYRLTVSIETDAPGKGGGSVNSDPGGIACTGGTCFADFSPGTAVALYQSPGANSTYATWTGPCTLNDTNCIAITDEDKTVTATFPYAFMVKLNSTGSRFDTLAEAFSAAAVSDTILLRDVILTEDVILAVNKAISLKGGMSTNYTPMNTWSTINGSLTIANGCIFTDRLEIR